jgi:outer membrane protein assembly factor BamB
MRLTTLLLLLGLFARAEPTTLFQDPTLSRDSAWLGTLPELLTPQAGAKPLTPVANRARVPLKGSYHLPMPAEGEVIRLRLYDCHELHLGFPGEPGTLISRMHNNRLTAFRAVWPNELPAHEFGPTADPIFAQKPYLVRVDPIVNFNWAGGPTDDRSDNFAARWQGFLIAPADGVYQFGGKCDDGMRIYVDEKLVIESWRDQTETLFHGKVTLTAGAHPIAMEYYEAAGQAAAKLFWKPPGAAEFAIIPSSVLRTSQAADAKPGLYGHYVATSEDLGASIASRVHRLHDDGFQWLEFGRGNLDIRYQDGEIILARGDIVLLRAPHPKPSSHVALRVTAHLEAAHKFQAPPLAVSGDLVAAGTRPDESPGSDAWVKDESGGGVNSTLEPQDDGGILFRRPASGGYAYARTRIPTKTGAVITFHLQDFSSHAGVFIEGPFGDGRRQHFLAGDRQVLCQDPGNHSHVNDRARDGFYMPDAFWLRFEVGFNQVVVSTSIDHERWSVVSRDPVEAGKYQVQPDIVLGLILAASNSPCELRIGPPVVRRWHRIEALAARLGSEEGLSHVRPSMRRTNAFHVLSDANEQDYPLSEIAAALRELMRRSGARGEDRDGSSGRWHALESLIRRIVVRQWSLGDRQAYADLKSAWRDSLPLIAQVSRDCYDYPDHLDDYHLLDLWTRGEWEALWYETERYRFQTLSRESDPYPQIGRTNTGRMVEELRDFAANRLGIFHAGRLRAHPLRIDSNRDSQNLLAEFATALEDGDFTQAGRLLTGDELPPGLAATADADLFLPMGEFLRRQAVAHAPLRQHLRDKFGAIAGLRLATARLGNRPKDFQTLRDQFPGTDAARAAALHLADRDLSMGRFSAARYAYQRAQQQTPEDAALQAKIDLTGDLLADSAAENPRAPGHRNFRMNVLSVRSLGRQKLGTNHSKGASAGFTAVGDRIVVNHLTTLFAISADGKRLLWEHACEDVPPVSITPAAAVCLQDIVIAPTYLKKEKWRALAGRQLEDGKLQWQHRLPGQVIGNPLVHDGSVLVWTYRLGRGQAQLIMNRVEPLRGNVLESVALASFAFDGRQLPELRSALHSGHIYSTIENTLLRYDLDGQLSWLRRLPRLSRHSMGTGQHFYQPQPPMVAHGQLLVHAQSAPGLFALDPESGATRWTHWQRSLHRVLVLGDQICALGRDNIELIDPANGKVQRYWHTVMPPDSVFPAADGSLLIADIMQNENPRLQRALKWFDPRTGAEQSCHISQHKDQYGLRGLWSNGSRVFGILVNKAQKGNLSFAVLD